MCWYVPILWFGHMVNIHIGPHYMDRTFIWNKTGCSARLNGWQKTCFNSLKKLIRSDYIC